MFRVEQREVSLLKRERGLISVRSRAIQKKDNTIKYLNLKKKKFYFYLKLLNFKCYTALDLIKIHQMSNSSLNKNELIILTPSLIYMLAKGVCEAKADATVQKISVSTDAQSNRLIPLHAALSNQFHFFFRIRLWYTCSPYCQLTWIPWHIFAAIFQKSHLQSNNHLIDCISCWYSI